MSNSIDPIQSININHKSLDTSRIYKVKYLVNNVVDTIYVFNGKKNTDNEDELFKTIFTDEENEYIKQHHPKIIFSDQQIHLDDSIGTIKLKIMSETKKRISLDEIYLFCKKFPYISFSKEIVELLESNVIK